VKGLCELHELTCAARHNASKTLDLRNKIYGLAEELSIDLDEARRVWREYEVRTTYGKHDVETLRAALRPQGKSVGVHLLKVPTTILAMHALISEASKYECDRRRVMYPDGAYRTMDGLGTNKDWNEKGEPFGFPICLARLDLMAEELAAVKR
jgi:hypothetical protein